MFSPISEKLESILDNDRGIECPTNVHVDKDGEKIIIISKSGARISNYNVVHPVRVRVSVLLFCNRIHFLYSNCHICISHKTLGSVTRSNVSQPSR